MTTFDTSVQYQHWRERRIVGLVFTALLFAAAAYLVVAYLATVSTSRYPTTTIPVAIAIFLCCVALVPLAVAFIRREHPTSVDVNEEGFTLKFHGGRTKSYLWDQGPLDVGVDGRTATHHAPPEGLECRVWIPVPGRDPQVPAFRPLELIVSGPAFDKMSAGMSKAGFRPVRQPWGRHRPGDMIQFVRPGEEARPPPAEPVRRSLLRPGG